MRDNRKSASARSSIDFVTFHAAIPEADTVHPNASSRHREYLAMIDMMFGSARLFHRQSSATVLTDPETDLSRLKTGVRRCEYRINARSLMYDRTLAQCAYVEASDVSQPLALLDSDILFNGSLDLLMKEDFDIAVTWRANDEMPINGGLILLNNLRPDAVKRFFRRFRDTFTSKYADRRDWFGDQLALRDCVGLTHREMSSVDSVSVAGCTVRLLPCDTYNYSPDNSLSSIVDPLQDCVVLHFKGQRKRLMPAYWRTHLEWRQQPLGRLRGALRGRALRRQAELENAQGGQQNARLRGGDGDA